jgi:Tfp pilus assembly ATPase PilU
MQLLDDHLWELYESEKIDLQEMLDKSRYPAALLDKAEKLHKGSTTGVKLKDDLVAMVEQKE